MKKTTNLETGIIIGDLHVPYEDARAVKLVLEIAKDLKVDHFIINGDFFDMYSVSRHSKDPRRAFNLKNEIDDGKALLNKIKKIGARNNVFLGGNHEDRLERYLRDRAPELYEIISIPKILELDRLGFKYIPYKNHYQIGKLFVTHDVGVSGKYAVWRALDAFQHNIVTGHTHRFAHIVEGDARGVRHTAASLGHLCNLNHVDYMHKIKATRDWSPGFGIFWLDPKTRYTYLAPIPIVEYSCVIGGKLYKG